MGNEIRANPVLFKKMDKLTICRTVLMMMLLVTNVINYIVFD